MPAATVINLSDPVSTLVTKTNQISTHVGDKSGLTTSATTDLVAAINEVHSLTNANINEVSEITNEVRTDLQNTGDITLGGRTTFTGGTNPGILADSADIQKLSSDSAILTGLSGTTMAYTTGGFGTLTTATANVTTLAIDGRNLTDAKLFQIKNSAGSVILAGYLMSTSDTPGTP